LFPLASLRLDNCSNPVEIRQLDQPSAQIHVLILIWLRADLEKTSCFLCSSVVLKLGDMGCKSLCTYRREDLDVSFFRCATRTGCALIMRRGTATLPFP
jgi:hypothetical protein